MPWYDGYTGPVPVDNPIEITSLSDIAPAVRWYRDFFEQQHHPLGYFAALYTKVSEEIEQAYREGTFRNPELFAAMDVRFATRYLQAMDAYLHRGETTHVWKVAIVATERPRPTVLQHLLAALNAHVNLDLPVASAEAAPGAKIHELYHDFEAINTILFGLMATIQRDLGEVFWPIRWWNRLLGTLDDHALKVGLFGARSLAWRKAVQLAEASPKQKQVILHQLDQRFVEVGKALVWPRRRWVRWGMWWVRRNENGTVAEKIQRLVD